MLVMSGSGILDDTSYKLVGLAISIPMIHLGMFNFNGYFLSKYLFNRCVIVNESTTEKKVRSIGGSQTISDFIQDVASDFSVPYTDITVSKG